MRVLTERSIEHNQTIYVGFVDYEKAFDDKLEKDIGNAQRINIHSKGATDLNAKIK